MTKGREGTYELDAFEQCIVYFNSTKGKIAWNQLKFSSKQVMKTKYFIWVKP